MEHLRATFFIACLNLQQIYQPDTECELNSTVVILPNMQQN